MAAVAEIQPGAGELEVDANRPVRVNITDATGITLSLVEVVVNGISHTLANGRLRAWQTTTILGGAIVDDTTDVWFETACAWYDGELDEVEVDVRYNSSSIDTATFTTRSTEGLLRNAEARYWAYALEAPLSVAPGAARYLVAPWYQNATYEAQFIVYDLTAYPCADGWYYVATPYRDTPTISGVVATPELWKQAASGTVQGTRRDLQGISGVVQGDQVDRLAVAGLVGVVFVYRGASSGIVGVEVLERVPASGVVYAVNASNELEVHVLDESTYAELVAQGFVIS